MKRLLMAAAVFAVAAPMAFAAPASAQNRDYRQLQRECNRALSRAETRSEYRHLLRECRREQARAQRNDYYSSSRYYSPSRYGYSNGSRYYDPSRSGYYDSYGSSPYGYGYSPYGSGYSYDPYYQNGVTFGVRIR